MHDGDLARTLQAEINLLQNQEDIHWRQRGKMDWLKMGDCNTKYFHACANRRRKTNKITKIRTVDGLVRESQEEIRTAFVEYFSYLFLAGPAGEREPVLRFLSQRVSSTMNDSLLQEFRKEEVDAALKQMGPFKAPGPDGIPAGFYQHHWATLGGEVGQAILDILNSGSMPPHLNSTNIVLIPKKKNAESVTDF